MTETCFRYPFWRRLVRFLDFVIVALIAVGGISFVLSKPPGTPKVWVLLLAAIAFFGFSAYRMAVLVVRLGDSLQISEAGLTYSEFGREAVLIPWSDVQEIRDAGAFGEVDIKCSLRERPIRVLRWLVSLGEFRAGLERHFGVWGKAPKGNGLSGGRD